MRCSLQVTLHAYEVEDLYEVLVFVGWAKKRCEDSYVSFANAYRPEGLGSEPAFLVTIASVGRVDDFNEANEHAVTIGFYCSDRVQAAIDRRILAGLIWVPPSIDAHDLHSNVPVPVAHGCTVLSWGSVGVGALWIAAKTPSTARAQAWS